MKIINFMGKKKLVYAFSCILLLMSILSITIKGFNLGPDFVGGTMVEIKFSANVDSNALKSAYPNFTVQHTNNNTYIMKGKAVSEKDYGKMKQDLTSKFGENKILSNQTVQGIIGGETSRGAIIAVILAALMIIIYLTIRFQFFFSIGGVVALLHDILIVCGIFSLFNIEIGMQFVAAMLTILGFSINDTIVVFDRIRDNLKFRKKSDTKEEIINKSITSTLERSIMTSVSVLLVLFSILIFGSSATWEFALAMILGTIFGSYSSIAVASPLWLDLSTIFEKFKNKESNKNKNLPAKKEKLIATDDVTKINNNQKDNKENINTNISKKNSSKKKNKKSKKAKKK